MICHAPKKGRWHHLNRVGTELVDPMMSSNRPRRKSLFAKKAEQVKFPRKVGSPFIAASNFIKGEETEVFEPEQ